MTSCYLLVTAIQWYVTTLVKGDLKWQLIGYNRFWLLNQESIDIKRQYEDTTTKYIS